MKYSVNDYIYKVLPSDNHRLGMYSVIEIIKQNNLAINIYERRLAYSRYVNVKPIKKRISQDLYP